MLPFALTIFLSAFLLFQVQLFLAKYILPWFGGSPAVWTACNLFFQALLLGGYAYGHLISNRLSPAAQKRLHQVVLLASLAVLGLQMVVWKSPVTPDKSWQPATNDNPVFHIIVLLAVSVGLPFLILASTAPLLQAWVQRTRPQVSVYRLYALSNFASLLALLSYPVLVEPWLTLRQQANVWTWMFLAFALSCGVCAELAAKSVSAIVLSAGTAEIVSPNADTVPPTKGLRALWLGLAACGSVLFLATTNLMCQEIAVFPFLWVLPLSLYLLSFILCFERKAWYSRRWLHPAFGLALPTACFVLFDGVWNHMIVQVALYSVVLFICCMVCHGELARLKPAAQHLTLFYLMVAGGGALGGVFVALLAPRIFSGIWEYQAGLGGAAALLVVVLLRDSESWLRRGGAAAQFAVTAMAVLLPVSILLATPDLKIARGLLLVLLILSLLALLFHLHRRRRKEPGLGTSRAIWISSVATLAVLATVLVVSAGPQSEDVVAKVRNFYGVLTVRVDDAGDSEEEANILRSGVTIHGVQFRAEERRRAPTSYYGEDSGVGWAVDESRKRIAASRPQGGLRLGVVGLGVGTMAAYGQAGDTIRFYEINPLATQLATSSSYFSYIKDSAARVEIISGDARISMTRELERGESQNFDVLVLDAFTGDAIPVHLLTREAIAIYLQHLAPGGILAVHISNRFLDLEPVVHRAAAEFGLHSAWISNEDDKPLVYESDWILLSPDAHSLDSPELLERSEKTESTRRVRLWTDDYSNLFQVLAK